MTSEEINEYKKRNDAIDLNAFWLREIAYQLAVANELKQIQLQWESEARNS